MQAAWYAKNGPATEVLTLGELPMPEPGPGEVRVRVMVSGVNPSDVKSRAGSRPVTSGIIVPHSDGAGVIESVGQGVAAGRVGERVWLWNAQWRRPMGTAAQYLCVPAAQAAPLPDATSFEAGACLGIPALTAMHGVNLLGELQGKTVLVIGASSAVGFYAAQMARLKGARVIGTVGAQAKTEMLRQIGVTDFIFYKQESVAERAKALTDGTGVDGVIDMDFSTTAPLVPAGAVAPHGTVVSYGSNFRGDVPIDFSAWLPRSISLRFFLVYDLLPAERIAAIDGLSAWLHRGQLLHHVGARFSLDDIAQAHMAVEGGTVFGNTVVAIP